MTKNYNENNIREAAYYNWMNAGCPCGQDEYFWNQAISQLYGSKGSCGCTKGTSKSCTSKPKSSSKSSTSKKTIASKSKK